MASEYAFQRRDYNGETGKIARRFLITGGQGARAGKDVSDAEAAESA